MLQLMQPLNRIILLEGGSEQAFLVVVEVFARKQFCVSLLSNALNALHFFPSFNYLTLFFQFLSRSFGDMNRLFYGWWYEISDRFGFTRRRVALLMLFVVNMNFRPLAAAYAKADQDQDSEDDDEDDDQDPVEDTRPVCVGQLAFCNLNVNWRSSADETDTLLTEFQVKNHEEPAQPVVTE